MRLVFLGTRGEIEARTRRHRMHTSLEVSYRGRRVMIDAGEDWRGKLGPVAPRAIVVTHGHPDHAFGLKDGAPCPVWATEDGWEIMSAYPIPEGDRRLLAAREPAEVVPGITFEAFPVEHSIRAPAVGYRISAGAVTIFYAPDLVFIIERAGALRGCSLYVGDGATMARSFVRRRGDRLIGHAPVRTQLGWCQKEGVPRAIITHCGTEIVEGDERVLGARLRAWGRERGVEAGFAYDGMGLTLRG
ncbi:MAG: MBL fold metallo-hydrolase [Gemmatimonadota bacterium]